jgi:hypothetical protein
MRDSAGGSIAYFDCANHEYLAVEKDTPKALYWYSPP